jgi:hypothetical protein
MKIIFTFFLKIKPFKKLKDFINVNYKVSHWMIEEASIRIVTNLYIRGVRDSTQFLLNVN